MAKANSIRVWDPGVRLFHWGLVATFSTSYLSHEMHDLHTWSGYTLIGLLLFRILWGFVGGTHARFGDFLYGPRAVIAYLLSLSRGQPIHYEGHNPAGGWVIYIMLTLLLLIAFSGLKALGHEGEGPFADNRYSLIASAYAHGDEVHRKAVPETSTPDQAPPGVITGTATNEATESGSAITSPATAPLIAPAPSREEQLWSETHEILVNLMLLLIAIHIAGVIVSSRLHRENLVRAMITGNKHSRD